MGKNLLLSMLFAFAVSLTANAQGIIPDMTLKGNFIAQVKSLDEFQARFNGAENKPGSEAANDSLTRVNNIISLFDFQIDKKRLDKEQFRELLYSFVDSVLTHHIQFDMLSHRLWSECKCRFFYNGKVKHITLILQKELFNNDIYRWAIVAVKGLDSADVINERFYPISPVEHEIYFMGFQDLLNENHSHAFGYRSKSIKIDQLSVFLTLVQIGKLEFDLVEEQIIHFLDVPGFAFTVKEQTRTGQNSGWLINYFQKMDMKEKENYIIKLLGYED